MAVLNAVERGIKPLWKVRVHFQQPEDYTLDGGDGQAQDLPLLLSVGRISAALSSEGGYAVSNTTVILKNDQRYFSRKFARELPVKRLVEIFITLNGTDILRFRGIVGNWKYSNRTNVELTVNA
jgi:hypothetical protein